MAGHLGVIVRCEGRFLQAGQAFAAGLVRRWGRRYLDRRRVGLVRVCVTRRGLAYRSGGENPSHETTQASHPDLLPALQGVITWFAEWHFVSPSPPGDRAILPDHAAAPPAISTWMRRAAVSNRRVWRRPRSLSLVLKRLTCGPARKTGKVYPFGIPL